MTHGKTTAWKIALKTVLGLMAAALLAGAVLMVVPRVGRAAPALAAADGPDGGHVLSGPLAGVTSGRAAFAAGLGALRGQFDATPTLLGAVGSADGYTVIAAFRAKHHGAPVEGLAVADYDPAGHSRFSALYDDPKRLAQSLPPMVAQLKTLTLAALERDRPVGSGSGAAGGPDFAAYASAAKHVPLTRTSFPDGTATIGVADGFTPSNMSEGTFSAAKADGAYANLYMLAGMYDPNGSIPRMERQMGGSYPPGQIVVAYDPDPVAAWKNRFAAVAQQRGGEAPEIHVLHNDPTKSGSGRMVSGTMTIQGEPYVFSGMLLGGMPPGADGGWAISITMRVAPLAHADTDMPALMAMQDSEKIDLNAIHTEVMRNISASAAALAQWSAASHAGAMDAMQRRFQSSMDNAEAVQDGIDRSSAGFIHYIRDQAVVEHNATGAGGTMDAGLAGALVQADPQNYHIVPVSEYVKGRDYH